jgi:D-ribose pyranase
MKKRGILNTHLSAAVSKLGHGDIILIGDLGCAFPISPQVECIDLAVTDGIPLVKDVLKVVLEELEIESYIVPAEMPEQSGAAYKTLKEIISSHDKDREIKCNFLPHIEMKKIWVFQGVEDRQMRVFVRTGERTAYGYIMLVAGVNF